MNKPDNRGNGMNEKITKTRHIRQQLEILHQQKCKENITNHKIVKKYKGLGLNWRDVVILIMALFFVGLYQAQAHAQNYFNLDDIDTSMMLAYNKQNNNYAALELLTSEYTVDITGIFAQVTLKQTYHNNTSNWVEEGLYAFPVAHNAAVYQMKFIIGERIIDGEIHEIKQAQKIYQQAKNQGLAASIVKQYRPNLFTTEVANIMPNEKVQVQISYQQTLKYDAGHIDFRLPLAIKSRYMQEQFLADSDTSGSKVENLQDSNLPTTTINVNNSRTINITLEAGFELSELKSLYHDVSIQSTKVFQHIKLNDNRLYDDNDFVLRWYPIEGNEPQAAMFSEKLDGQEYVLLMLLPPNISQSVDQQREVVFIIDTSGSMHGQALNAAKDALFFGLTQIKPNDKFNIIEFNSYATELFSNSVMANSENLDKAIDFIDKLKSDGGTNMGPALSLSMQDDVDATYLKQIIFITDGSMGNEAQLFRQINQQIGKARLFTVAIGSAPNNYFMNKAALIGRGTYTNIANLNDVDNSMNELFIKLSSPALTDVAIEWNGNAIQNPKIIPDLYMDQPVIVTAKIKSFDSNIVLSGYTDKNTFSKQFNLNKDGLSKGIAKLWARNQIEDFTDDYMLGGEMNSDRLQQQITDIALKYHLVSKFTSLVAVDKTPDMSRLVAIQAQALNRTKTIALANYPQTALGWKLQMLIGLVFMFLALVSRRLTSQ